jgi:hypothetical protein
LLTEIQAYCRFDGANIGERVGKICEVLMPRVEVKESYDGRYARLMADRRISPRKGA